MVRKMPRPLHWLQVYEVSKYSNLIKVSAHFFSAEIDKLIKHQAAKPVEKEVEEIPRPPKFKSLQDAMGLADNKRLYSHCRVSLFYPFPSPYG